LGDENKEWATQKGWTTSDKLPELAKGYRNVEKMSSGMVKLPTPESAAEEIRSFYQKAGCPENPDGYEVQVPEEVSQLRDELLEGTMKQIAYDQGVSKQAFEAIVRKYYEAAAENIIKSTEKAEQELKAELGDKYEESIKIADRFFDTCSPEFCQLVKDVGLGRHPVFIREFIAKGKQTMADTLVKGEVSGDKAEEGYRPKFPDSPEMYRAMEGPEGEKARAYFIAKGHTY
jgi:hypothetical protein